MMGRSPTVATNASTQAMLSHSGEKFFAARNVASLAPKLVNLKIHIQTHPGEKPFNCDQCNYSTTQAAHLSQHMRKHTGEKLLKCNQCN